MPPDFFFSAGLRSAAIFGAPRDIAGTDGAGGGANRLIGRAGCGFGEARVVFKDCPDDFGILRSYVFGQTFSETKKWETSRC
jgi:hypothetical protein